MSKSRRQMSTFQAIRLLARDFCVQREWMPFHQPRNLLLALAGEAGELSEIFQWKGDLSNGLDSTFSKRDVEHIGEEIADVFIYSTRLCDICDLNLSDSILERFNACTTPVTALSTICTPENSWVELSFSELENLIQNPSDLAGKLSRSPRDLLLMIHQYIGDACASFRESSEDMSPVGLTTWKLTERRKVVDSVAKICICLSWISTLCGLRLEECILDKMAKNAAKYPVNLVKGKSAKYTVYQKKEFERILGGIIQVLLGVGAGFLIGRWRK